MNPRFSVFLFVLIFMIGCTSTGAPPQGALPNETVTGPDVASPTAGAPTGAPTTTPTPIQTPMSTEGIAGCEINWKRDARLKALNTAVEKSDLETQNVKDGFVNSSQRSRLAILSAGLIPDDVPFVSLDRSCWSEFYRAHQNLRDGKERLAKKAAEGWRLCLTANFPDRSIQAQKLYQCFGLTPASEDPSSAE